MTDHRPVEAAVQRLHRLHPKLIDLSLGRLHRLLAALDRPQDRLPPVIHVAGTNGKGSVVAMLRAVLRDAGLRCHVYTSPHLVRFNERIVLADQIIADDALQALIDRVEAANGEAPITFFEVTTAVALLGFAETPADVVLLETGLGGRLDATNVVRRPAATIVTLIGFDHMDFLGNSLAAIAGEKAGIFKPGVPAIIGPQGEAEALAVLRDRAAALGAPAQIAGQDWQARQTDTGMTFENEGLGLHLTLPRPGLPGRHQIDNAGSALAGLAASGLLDFEALRAAAPSIARADWPARLQRLTSGPLTEQLPGGWALWLDGGHNPAAGKALAGQLEAWQDKPTHLILGMLARKDAAGFLAPLRAHLASLSVVPVPGYPDGSITAEQAGGQPAASLAEAVRRCTGGGSTGGAAPGRILIAGSLYLAGAVLAEHG